jgi:hypothetical protein
MITLFGAELDKPGMRPLAESFMRNAAACRALSTVQGAARELRKFAEFVGPLTALQGATDAQVALFLEHPRGSTRPGRQSRACARCAASSSPRRAARR